MSILQILQILRAHYRVALITPLVIFLGTVIVSLQLPKEFAASTALVVDIKTDPIAGVLMPTVGTPSYMTTQTEIIQSDRVAGKVVSLLRLDKSPMAVERWKEDTAGKVPFESYWGSLLQKGLVVKPSRGSNIINLTYASHDAKFATAVANAYAQAYIDVTIDLRVEPARQYAVWFDERLKGLRAGLEAAQAKLSAYQKDKGIVATDERLDQETARLNGLMTELASAQADKVATSTRQKNTGSELSPDVQQNPIIQSLKSELARAETRMSEISSNVGANHPQRVQLEAQIAGLKQRLNEEMHRISGGSATATRVSAQRETELMALIDARKKQILGLRDERDELTILLRDVESAQRTYDIVAQRMSQNSLESQSDQTNVRVLSPAVEPITPSGPKVARNVAMSVLMGILAGMGLAIGMEFLDRRVRTPEDLAVPEGVPVLGILRPQQTKFSLKARLDALGAWLRRTWQRRMRRRQPVGVGG